jgi:hypothetical protein
MTDNRPTGAKTEDDTELDEALEMTFPASDPVSIAQGEGDAGPRLDRKTAPLDRDLVDRLAAEVKRRTRAS